MSEDKPKQDTDIELWRERPGDYYSDHVFLTKNGGIGINCGGSVVVRTPRRWQAMVRENDRMRDMLKGISKGLEDIMKDMEKGP